MRRGGGSLARKLPSSMATIEQSSPTYSACGRDGNTRGTGGLPCLAVHYPATLSTLRAAAYNGCTTSIYCTRAASAATVYCCCDNTMYRLVPPRRQTLGGRGTRHQISRVLSTQMLPGTTNNDMRIVLRIQPTKINGPHDGQAKPRR